MKEIERKFLVKDLGKLWPLLSDGAHIFQGYLFSETARSCRVRIKGSKGYITIKFGENALARDEFEYEIPIVDAQGLLSECSAVLDKTRYIVLHEGLSWEIDVFHGNLEGFVIAELELTHEDQVFLSPDWLGEEVTHDPSYLNVNLIKRL
jgi:CYTH domain-containing protein